MGHEVGTMSGLVSVELVFVNFLSELFIYSFTI